MTLSANTFALLSSLLILSAVSTAFAQPAADVAQARELFRGGVEHLRAERWAEACESLDRSAALVETAPTHLNLALCSGELGRVLDQSEHLRAFLRLAGPDVDPARITEAETTIAAIAERIPTVVPNVNVASDAVLTLIIAGAEIPRAAWGTPRPVNPGAITVRASGAAYLDFSQTVQVREGERIEVEIVPVPRPEEARPADTQTPIIIQAPAVEEPRSRAGLIIALVVSVAVIGAGLGTYFALRDPPRQRANWGDDVDGVFEALRIAP